MAVGDKEDCGRAPETRYAKSGDLSIAYAAYGDGPDLAVAQAGSRTWKSGGGTFPRGRSTYLLVMFRRVILFDKRGTGLSK